MVELTNIKVPHRVRGCAEHVLVVSCQSLHFLSVGGDHDTVHFDAADCIAAQALCGVCVEEGRVGVAFLHILSFPPLAPHRRAFLDCQMKAVLAQGAYLSFHQRKNTRFLQGVKKEHYKLAVRDNGRWRPGTPSPNLCRSTRGLEATSEISGSVVEYRSFIPGRENRG